MRDDLHKEAPVPKSWKNLIKWCSRGTWETDGPAAAQRALGKVSKELTPTLLRDAARAIESPRLGLGSTPELELLRQENAGPLSVAVFFDQLAYSVAGTPERSTNDLISEAVKTAMDECPDRYLRATVLHVNKLDPRNAGELIRRMKVSLSAAREGNVVKRASGPVRPEEDLL